MCFLAGAARGRRAQVQWLIKQSERTKRKTSTSAWPPPRLLGAPNGSASDTDVLEALSRMLPVATVNPEHKEHGPGLPLCQLAQNKKFSARSLQYTIPDASLIVPTWISSTSSDRETDPKNTWHFDKLKTDQEKLRIAQSTQ
jgi:hypothetical protein